MIATLLAKVLATIALLAPNAQSGIYDSCAADCQPRIQRAAQGGFDLVMNYASEGMDPAAARTYSAQASAAGMKVIWNVSRRTQPVLDKLQFVSYTARLPGTWGYYVGDELPTAEVGLVSSLASNVTALTGRPTLYVSRPHKDLLAPFRPWVTLAGPDPYPWGSADPGVCRTVRWSAHGPSAVVLQAFSWRREGFPWGGGFPNARTMRAYRNAAIKCAPDRPLILWYSMQSIDRHPNPAGYWRKVAWAANGR